MGKSGKIQRKTKKLFKSDNMGSVINNELVGCKNVTTCSNIKINKMENNKWNDQLKISSNQDSKKGELESGRGGFLTNKFSVKRKKLQNGCDVESNISHKKQVFNPKFQGKAKSNRESFVCTDSLNESELGLSSGEGSASPCKGDAISEIDDPSTDNDSDVSSNHSVSSFNIDSYPSDDEEDEETDKMHSIPFNSVPSAELDEKENRTIFVGNLPKNIERDELHKWFSRFGKVDCVRLRSAPIADLELPKKVAVIKKSFHENRSNIHAYIRFKDVEGSSNALQANGIRYRNHTLRVDCAKHKGSYDAKKAIFVGNVPFAIEEDSLISLFLKCGEIDGVRIIRDKETGVGKGFAYVNFKCSSSVPLALKLDGEMLEKRPIRVKPVKYNQKKKHIIVSSKLKNKVDISRFKGRMASPRNIQSKGGVQEKDKHKAIRRPGIMKNKFQGEFSQRRERKTFKRKSFVTKKREIVSKILTNKKKNIEN